MKKLLDAATIFSVEQISRVFTRSGDIFLTAISGTKIVLSSPASSSIDKLVLISNSYDFR